MAVRVTAIVERRAHASRAALRRAVSVLRPLGYEFEFKPIETDLRLPEARPDVDVVLVSTTGSGKTAALVAEVKRSFPHARLLLTCDSFTTTVVSDAYKAGASLVAPPGAFVKAVQNVLTLSDVVHVSEQLTVSVGRSRHPIEKEVVDEFHDSTTGRVDAKRVADAYGVSLSALATALGVTQSALSKRTTALSAQPGLRELEFAWAALLDAVKTPERVRAWLNAHRHDLDGRTPLALLLEGSAEAFANYIRSIVAGEPG